MTPTEREAAQLDVVTVYLDWLAVKAERAKFLRKHPEMTDGRCGKRGQFGNTRASAKYAGLRFAT